MVILIQCHNTYLIQLYAYRFNFHFRRYCVNSNMDTYTVYSGTSSTYWKTRLQNLAFVLFCFVHQLGPSVIIIVVGFSLGVAVEKDFTFPFVHAIVHVPKVSP